MGMRRRGVGGMLQGAWAVLLIILMTADIRGKSCALAAAKHLRCDAAISLYHSKARGQEVLPVKIGCQDGCDSSIYSVCDFHGLLSFERGGSATNWRLRAWIFLYYLSVKCC